MLEKGMQKVWKLRPKWSPNGSQHLSKIRKKGGKKACQNWCWNLKPNKIEKIDFSIDPGRPKGRFLGGPGGRGADFRRYLADFIRSSITLCTPAGCGGLFDEKTVLGRQRFDWEAHFGWFLRVRKNVDFSMSIRRAKKSKKQFIFETMAAKGTQSERLWPPRVPRPAANYQRNTRKKQQRLRRRS